MKLLQKYSWLALGLAACQPDINVDPPTLSAGEANFATYVALGNSLTAGFNDGALFAEGQNVSYPNLMAQQFRQVGGGNFTQPLMPAGRSAGSPALTPQGPFVPSRLALRPATDCLGNTSLAPAPADANNNADVLLNPAAFVNAQAPFNNLGVPGAKSFHLLFDGYGNPNNLLQGLANPFYVRMASNPGQSTVLSDALTQNPTFFTLWIGNNDLLGYALTGGTGDPLTPVDGPPGVGFRATMETLVGALTANGAKGAIATLPNPGAAPFFSTVPTNGLVLQRQGQVDSLRSAYAQLGINLELQVGVNGFVAETKTGIRTLRAGERLLLTTPGDSLRCGGWGSTRPIPDRFVMDETEIAQLRDRHEAFNGVIRTLANSSENIVLVDIETLLNRVNRPNGLVIDGVTFRSTLVTGGVFGLDGLHLTPRGQGIVANAFIRTINRDFRASVPLVEVNDLPATQLP